MTAHVVLAGSDRIGLVRLRDALVKAGHQVETATGLSDARTLVRTGSAGILIVDVDDNNASNLPLLEALIEHEPDLEVVMVLGAISPADEQELISAARSLGVQTYLPRRITDTPYFASVLATVADHRRLRRANRQLRGELAKVHAELSRLKGQDGLAWLPDYQFLRKRLAQEMRVRADVSLMIIGVDNFEEILERHNRGVAERLLQELAVLLRSDLRDLDTLTRATAVEQFAAIMSGTKAVQAKIAARRIQEELAGRSVDIAGTSVSLSISVGIAEATEGMDANALMNRAEKAWQRAQRTEEKLAISPEP